MKKIFFASLLLPLLSLFGCQQPEEIVFDHEKPQFETREGMILLEVIVPFSTNHDKPIYITGPAIGHDEESVLGNDQWQLTQSPQRNKYGIYIDPATLASGKSLTDGYFFVSLQHGREVGVRGEEVMHTTTAPVGQRAENVWVRQWADFFDTPEGVVWPDVPAGMIQLRITVPDNTPMGYQIAAVGEFNGWSSTGEQYRTSAIDANHHYLNLDPAEFAAGKSLADEFELAVIVPGQEWWFHESNEDGSDEGGQAFTIANAIAGRGYEINVLNWRNSAELPQGIPQPSENQFLLMITVPDYTPENSLIGLFGGWNGWDAMLNDPGPWTATMFSPTLYYLVVNPSLINADASIEDMFHIALFFDDSTGGNWWRHQANEDGSGDEGAGINNADNPASPRFDFVTGSTYNITVAEWRYSDEIKSGGQDPEDTSVAPWKGLTVDAGKILLQLELPHTTPFDTEIAIVGTLNGWNGADVKWTATMYSPRFYYIMLDPADFALNTSLKDEFKIAIMTGANWYDHENSDGGKYILNTEAGKAYQLTISGWRDDNNELVVDYPNPVPADRIMIKLDVPGDTPESSNIIIAGDINDWNGDAFENWAANMVTPSGYYLLLDPSIFKSGAGLTAATTTNGFDIAVRVEGKDWWYFQSEGGNKLLPDGATVGNSYDLVISAWKNAGEL